MSGGSSLLFSYFCRPIFYKIAMYLDNNLKKNYTHDSLSAYEAQRLAQLYAFGPMTFQTARLMVKWGIFEMLETPMTPEEVAEKAGISLYAAKCLLESSLTMNTAFLRYGRLRE